MQRRASVPAAGWGRAGRWSSLRHFQTVTKDIRHPERKAGKSLAPWRHDELPNQCGDRLPPYFLFHEKSPCSLIHLTNKYLRFCSGSGPGNRTKQAKEPVFLEVHFWGESVPTGNTYTVAFCLSVLTKQSVWCFIMRRQGIRLCILYWKPPQFIFWKFYQTAR